MADGLRGFSGGSAGYLFRLVDGVWTIVDTDGTNGLDPDFTFVDTQSLGFAGGVVKVASHQQVAPTLVQDDGAGVLQSSPVIAALPGGGYVITVLMSLDPFKKLMPSTTLYEVSALVTRDGKFIIRTMDQANRVGTPGSKYLQAAVAGGKQHGISDEIVVR